MMFNLPVVHGEKKSNITIYQGTGTTMDMYEYTEGTAPQNTNEIAITRISAKHLMRISVILLQLKLLTGIRNISFRHSFSQ